MASPVALKQTTVESTPERPATYSRSVPLWRTVLMPVASLKLTVALFALAIFLVFASTLAQKEVDVWNVIRNWYRVDAAKLFLNEAPYVNPLQLFVRIPVRIFFPDTFFTHPPQTDLAFWFPRGWLLGLLMAVNLLAAHTVRFTVQSKGSRLFGGLGVLAAGCVLTWAVIESGASRGGILGEAIIGWDMLWNLFLLGLATTAFCGMAAFFMLLPGRNVEKGIALTVAASAGGVLLWAIWAGEAAQFSPESMRILWQLVKGTVAAVVLLAGCVMVFKKRAGIVLLHAGVGLLFLHEVIVGTLHDEAQMPIFEGTKSNWVHDVREVEFAVTELGDEKLNVTAVPESLLVDGAVLDLPGTPFNARVVKFYKNSKLDQPDSAKGEKMPHTPATAGLGLDLFVNEEPPVTGVDADKTDMSSMYVELLAKDGGKPLGTYLVGTEPWNYYFMTGMLKPDTVDVAGKTYQLEMRPKRTYKPYVIEAVEVRKDDYLAGDTPRNYSSVLHVVDESRDIDRVEPIKMNNPMRFADETFYQSGFNKVDGRNITTIQVVSNEGWMLPYVSCMIVAVGMLMQFGGTLGRFLSRRRSVLPDDLELVDEPPARLRKGKAKSVAASEPVEADRPWWRNAGVVLPAVGVGLVLLMVGYTARKPTAKPEQMDFYAFGQLPVAFEDRVKPLDSMARSTLVMLSHRQTYKENLNDKNERSKPPAQWLLEVVANPDKADTLPVFRIDNLDAIKTLGLERNEHSRYSLNQIRDRLDEFHKQVAAINDKTSGVEPFEREIMKLDARIKKYLLIQYAFFDPELKVPDLTQARNNPQALQQEMLEVRRKLEAATALSTQMKRINPATGKSMQPPLAVPQGGDAWATYLDENLHLFYASVPHENPADAVKPNPAAVKLHAIFAAYKADDAAAFNRAVADYRDHLAAVPPKEYEPAQRDLETYLNYADPFFWSSYLYLLAGVVACVALLGLTKPLNRMAFWMICAVFAYHTISGILRMYVTGRPPVTNLYSSAVFIGWGAVLLGMIFEGVYKQGVGNLLSAIAGFGSLQIAYLLTRQGDTIESLQAVLDTQFWLTTHVVCITLGYATTFAAGLLGLIYVVLGLGTRKLTTDTGKSLGRMIYGTLCFALFFSFVGTVLGGLWADDSWGRFWGWDPKENGALIIVLWNALVLHARWDGMIRDRGMAVAAVGGNITTSWSWFGVNQLGVGLHSYGFSPELLSLLFWFVTASAAIVVVGLIPRRYWQSGDGKA